MAKTYTIVSIVGLLPVSLACHAARCVCVELLQWLQNLDYVHHVGCFLQFHVCILRHDVHACRPKQFIVCLRLQDIYKSYIC
ncbi:hypothetical protein FB192DRAFT_1391569 [Mucor lusitanicus]|uniref:Secreted protein n=1 Tax=Mucor circinelloides f. lusitanicus TaxID=29924 RepID=A0A8H4BA43_MUCCL|nr:hypothetical protein FB192DRAFT_1391569 [Mucor lusitanicus]